VLSCGEIGTSIPTPRVTTRSQSVRYERLFLSWIIKRQIASILLIVPAIQGTKRPKGRLAGEGRCGQLWAASRNSEDGTSEVEVAEFSRSLQKRPARFGKSSMGGRWAVAMTSGWTCAKCLSGGECFSPRYQSRTDTSPRRCSEGCAGVSHARFSEPGGGCRVRRYITAARYWCIGLLRRVYIPRLF
jgi:hypothetical protein